MALVTFTDELVLLLADLDDDEVREFAWAMPEWAAAGVLALLEVDALEALYDLDEPGNEGSA